MSSDLTWAPDGRLTHIGAPDWLVDPDLQALMAAFEAAGQQIHAVGGCVRDTALDRPVQDVDLSTDALPEVTERIAGGLGQGWKAVPTGIDHGTLTAVSPKGRPFEITTFRTDVETDGRHATVAFSKQLSDDAMRRDFTVNAFYVDRTGRVQDPVGGSADLKARRIRFIGTPEARIEEDYLRILRFFRFTASHGAPGAGPDVEGLAACAALAEGLEWISRERIGAEMTRLLAVADPAPVVGTMEQSGVLWRILPGAGVRTLSVLVHLEGMVQAQVPVADLATRLASLSCDEVAERLRLSKALARKIERVTDAAGSTMPARELGYRYGATDALHCLLLRWATLTAPVDQDAIDDATRGAGQSFPVAAADLMPQYQGRALGERLQRLEQLWIDSRFTLTKAELVSHP
nr:CCA tRNA nucleotidyltransferase [Thalassorhabdomicrobium marinisediminis]